MSKSVILVVSSVVLVQAAYCFAGINVDVNIGTPVQPPPVVVVAPPPPVQPPAYAPAPEVIFDSQPRFIFSPALGFYVSVGVPYDVVYIGTNYYLYSGGYWYVGPTYSGPWILAKRRVLPLSLRKYPFEKIRYYRDAEYRVYLRDPAHYRGRLHEPVWRRAEPIRGDVRREEHHRDEPRREEHRGERW